MEVEVFSRSNEREACGWWTAAIKVSLLVNKRIIYWLKKVNSKFDSYTNEHSL